MLVVLVAVMHYYMNISGTGTAPLLLIVLLTVLLVVLQY